MQPVHGQRHQRNLRIFPGVATRPKTRPLTGQRVAPFFLAATFALSGCSDEPVEPTVAELLAEIEGRELTPAEVAERQEVAQFLCGVDDDVLVLLWADMTKSQLEFQDWVFGQECRDRSNLYAQATGRFSSTGEAVADTTTTTPATASTATTATTPTSASSTTAE